MPCKRTRNIRTAIQRTVLPRLLPGSPLPPARVLARALGLSHVAAWRHLRAVLAEAGMQVERSRVVQGRPLVMRQPT